jgi:hypothetical protein
MTHLVNGARGEVALRVGTVDLVIAAEIGRLASLSTALGCKSLSDLYTRLLNVEVAATLAGIQHLTVKGNAAQAVAELRLKDFPACKDAFAAALNHHVDGDAGKDDAAKGAAATKKPKVSPGATG